MGGLNGLSEPMCFSCDFAVHPLKRQHLFSIHSTLTLNLSFPVNPLLANRVWQKGLRAISEVMPQEVLFIPIMLGSSPSWNQGQVILLNDERPHERNPSCLTTPSQGPPRSACPTASKWQINKRVQLRSAKPGSDMKNHPFGQQSYELNKCLYCCVLLAFTVDC